MDESKMGRYPNSSRPTEMFHPALKWVEAPDGVKVHQGWAWTQDVGFTAPPPDIPEE